MVDTPLLSSPKDTGASGVKMGFDPTYIPETLQPPSMAYTNNPKGYTTHLREAIGAVRHALDPVAGHEHVAKGGRLQGARRVRSGAEMRHRLGEAQHCTVYDLRQKHAPEHFEIFPELFEIFPCVLLRSQKEAWLTLKQSHAQSCGDQ